MLTFEDRQRIRQARSDRAKVRVAKMARLDHELGAPLFDGECRGCGGPWSGNTIGCDTCSDRTRNRAKKYQESAASTH